MTKRWRWWAAMCLLGVCTASTPSHVRAGLLQSTPAISLPTQLSQTGIFRDLATLTPNTGVIPYEVNAPFWSDGALKRRWMALPGDGTSTDPSKDRIIVKPGLPWAFPAGTIFVKHFDLADEAARNGRRRLETRVLVRDTS